MGSRIVRVARKPGDSLWCVWEKDGIFPLQDQPRDHRDLLENYSSQRLAIQADKRLEPGAFMILPPVYGSVQIICQGKNYLEHLLETGVRPENKDYNLLFTKASSTLAPAQGELRRPEGVRLLDYELELGLVMRKPLTEPRLIAEDGLLDYVGALVMCNDVSARDVQIPERQWFKGKSFRGFCPVGPILYLLDDEDAAALVDLQLELRVNGKVRQKASTAQLMHKPHETLTEISRIFDLYPGDLVLTGTPGGVAMRIEKGWWKDWKGKFQSEKAKMDAFLEEQLQSTRYLKNGDVIESQIRSATGAIDLGEQHLVVS